ncbi:MAG: AAA family ATPase [Gammaproteobacteria bacterium]|nr:AAA family ATPase [Gammaproteobacteria bacterium]
MYQRILQLPKKKHFFLFGARNTGKSTLIKKLYDHQSSRYIDLLNSEDEDRYRQNPNILSSEVEALPSNIQHVIIDEIQKNPKLLDIVQMLMGKTSKTFVMTGSSARKLKHGGANLLAGRAFVYHLYPLSAFELGDDFNLNHALKWGTLPEISQCDTDLERQEFLNAYAHTYLKEEIINEQAVRNLDPFRKFLEVAAQCNGKIINYSNIARDVGADDKTIKAYYGILEDTLIGFMLDSYTGSFRKRLSQKPKFYYFDPGVVRALSRQTSVDIIPQTNAYGNAFEHFIILECIKLSDYHRKDFRFSYLRTPSDVEVDLIVERPGKALLCIEIKSSTNVFPEDISSFKQITLEIPNCEAVVLSQDKYAKKFDHVLVLPWQQGIKELFGDID